MAIAPLGWLRDRIVRANLVQEALRSRIDLAPFWHRSRARMFAGATLFGLGLLLGLPGVAFCVAAYFYLNNSTWLAVAPSIYAFSWLLWIIAFVLMGSEAMRHRRLLGLWLLRTVLRPWQGDDVEPEVEAIPVLAEEGIEPAHQALAVGDRLGRARRG
jgi:hypothetical protein